MHDKQQEIEGRLEVALDEKQIKNIFNDILRNIQTEGAKINIDDIMNEYGVSDEDRDMVRKELTQFTTDNIDALVYNRGIVPGREAADMTSEELGISVQKAVEKVMPRNNTQNESPEYGGDSGSSGPEPGPSVYETHVQNIQNIANTFNSVENVTEETKQQFINNLKEEITHIDKTTIEQSQVQHIENIENIINEIDQSTNQAI